MRRWAVGWATAELSRVTRPMNVHNSTAFKTTNAQSRVDFMLSPLSAKLIQVSALRVDEQHAHAHRGQDDQEQPGRCSSAGVFQSHVVAVFVPFQACVDLWLIFIVGC